MKPRCAVHPKCNAKQYARCDKNFAARSVARVDGIIETAVATDHRYIDHEVPISNTPFSMEIVWLTTCSSVDYRRGRTMALIAYSSSIAVLLNGTARKPSAGLGGKPSYAPIANQSYLVLLSNRRLSSRSQKITCLCVLLYIHTSLFDLEALNRTYDLSLFCHTEYLCYPSLIPFVVFPPFAVFLWVHFAAHVYFIRCWRYPPRDSVRILDGYGAPWPELSFAFASRYLPHGNMGNRIGDHRLWLRGGGFS